MNLRITVDNNEVRQAVADVILAEYGIPASPEDIEFVFIHGYGVRAVYDKEAEKDDQEGQG